jgi:S-methylmethionine transporter
VLVFEKVGIPYAADIFNFVILTAILSAANSGLYASGRMLWSLSNEKTPGLFCQSEQRRAADRPVGQYAGRRTGAVFQRGGAGYGLCRAVGSGFAVVAVWLSICASHFMFRRRHLQQGKR